MSNREQPHEVHKPTETVAAGGASGALIGGIAGLAAGLGAMAIPGVGPAIAAGPLAVAIGSAGIGAAAGGIIGALTAEEVADASVGQPQNTPEPPVEPAVTPTVPSGARIYIDGLEMDPRLSRFEDFEHDYQADFKARNLEGHTYEQFSPAYRYGYTLGDDPRFTNRDWLTIEDYARRGWESENPGSWDKVKDVVCYAWQSHRFARNAG